MASITLTLSSKTNKDTGKAEILLRYRNTRSVALRGHSHTFILPEYFKDGEIVIKARIITPKVQEAMDAKAQLDLITAHVIDAGNKVPIEDFTQDWLQDTIDRFLYPEKYKEDENAALTFQSKTADYLKYTKLSRTRERNYGIIFQIVHRYEMYSGNRLMLDTMTPEDLAAIKDFMLTEHTLFTVTGKINHRTIKPVPRYEYTWTHTQHGRAPMGRSENSVIYYMKAIRAYWHWCLDMGYTTNNPFKKFTISSQNYGTPVYLTTDERDRYYKAALGADEELLLARDIFVFQCYVGCRISDLFSFTPANIVKSGNGLSVQYIPEKTKKERQRVVKVYLAPTAVEIMNRHKGEDPEHIFPRMRIWKLNVSIREGLSAAGIDRVVTVVNPRTKQSEQHPICDVASSHMARRTFIGNLYKKVKDPNLVGKLSGHCEGSRAFARYRDIDDDMIREMTDLLD